MDGYRTLDSGYRAPSRQQLDPYGAQPQVSRAVRGVGSALELGGMRYAPAPYGMEDDQRSLGYDDMDYSMAPPPMHPGYGTMPRLGGVVPGTLDRRRLRLAHTHTHIT